MLRLTGRTADGCLPSFGYLPGGPSDLTAMNTIIDDSATAAGREPAQIRRLLNISGQFITSVRCLLNGHPSSEPKTSPA
jgi:hypothetical protein